MSRNAAIMVAVGESMPGVRLFDAGVVGDTADRRRECAAAAGAGDGGRPGTAMGAYRRVDADAGVPLGGLSESVLICGRASDGLDMLPDRSVQTVVTSPPYWSLRDYGTDGQIGRDDALADYVKSIVTTFDKIRRVLSDDGTVWLNIGDSYTSGNRRYRAPDRKNRARAMGVRPQTPEGLKPKDLIGVPWRLALALQDAGWWLRSEVIWHKPNAHPESVRDRPTKAHETVFLLSKSQSYYYDVGAVTGPNRRRLRTVWDINTEPRSSTTSAVAAHPAVMPTTLAQRCVMITSRPGDTVLDPYAGSGTTLLAAADLGRGWAGIELNPAYVDLIEHPPGRTPPGTVNDREALKRRIDRLSPMGVRFVIRMVDSL